MTQLAFREGRLTAELNWTTMILLLNQQEVYMGISLVEVIWKIINTIINTYLRVAISLHDSQHGFRQGGGGTATLESKLAQHLAGIFREPLL